MRCSFQTMILSVAVFLSASADVPKDVSDIRSHLAQMQIVWSNSVQEAYVIGTNACHETKAITNVFWRRTCMSNCLDAVVALPLQCHAKDMTSDYVFADIHQEEETAMEKRYYLVAGGCNLFGKEIADFTYDSMFLELADERREANRIKDVYNSLSVPDPIEFSAHFLRTHGVHHPENRQALRYFTGQIYARRSYAEVIDRRAGQHAYYLVDYNSELRLYYLGSSPERRADIRAKAKEVLGFEPAWIAKVHEKEAEEAKIRDEFLAELKSIPMGRLRPFEIVSTASRMERTRWLLNYKVAPKHRRTLLNRFMDALLTLDIPDRDAGDEEDVNKAIECLTTLYMNTAITSFSHSRAGGIREGGINVDFKLAVIELYDKAIARDLERNQTEAKPISKVEDERSMRYRNLLQSKRDFWVARHIDNIGLLFRHPNVVPANVKKDIAEKIRSCLGRYPRWYADEIKQK